MQAQCAQHKHTAKQTNKRQSDGDGGGAQWIRFKGNPKYP